MKNLFWIPFLVVTGAMSGWYLWQVAEGLTQLVFTYYIAGLFL